MNDLHVMSPGRPPQFPHQISPQEHHSASSGASLHGSHPPGSLGSPPGRVSRPSSSLGGPSAQAFQAAPRSGPAGYSPNYFPTSNPHGVQLPGYSDLAHARSSYGSEGAPGTPMAMGAQGQKRAYRQRRKDPSCDACRERKVKCDATETSSCTECTSRNVRCQFTKDTNRRMTSMKHNQDLTRELARMRADLDRYKSLAGQQGIADFSDPDTGEHSPAAEGSYHSSSPGPLHNEKASFGQELKHEATRTSPPSGQPASKKRKTQSGRDMYRIGSNMRNFGRGIIKSPYPWPLPPAESSHIDQTALLPPKSVAKTLLRQYWYTFQTTFPILPWIVFEAKLDKAYEEDSLETMASVEVALLFLVFALGTLHRDWDQGRRFMEIARSKIDLPTERPTLDHVRAALLISIFSVESNAKSVGWSWLGMASRIAYDIGLHCEAGTWSSFEEEMRRRVWWSIYICDCLLCLELGQPVMNHEEKFEVALPSPVDDRYLYDPRNASPEAAGQTTSPFLLTIHITKGISNVIRVLKTPNLSADTLRTQDDHLMACLRTLPPRHQIHASERLEAMELHPIMSVQSARLIMYRHNLSLTCTAQVRSKAIDDCSAIARETAGVLRRCMPDPQKPQSAALTRSMEQSTVSAVSAFLCMHMWRCTLFLAYRHDFASAMICARFGSIVGDARAVNTACGRYLDFFLDEMLARRHRDVGVDGDQEMLAYVSGDLQGNLEHAWVWQDGVKMQEDNVPPKSGDAPETNGHTRVAHEEPDWSGWGHVVDTLARLQADADHRDHQRTPPHLKTEGGFEHATQSPSSIDSPAASGRMNIRDLI